MPPKIRETISALPPAQKKILGEALVMTADSVVTVMRSDNAHLLTSLACT